MHVDLKNYLDSKGKSLEFKKNPGPVITISRAFGCEATPIARKLISKINHEAIDRFSLPWKIVSKEIIDHVAHEFKISAHKVKYVMDLNEISVFEHSFNALEKHYGPTKKNIINGIKGIIWLYANRGQSVILGRAGAYITREIPNSLHVRINAPIEWRIQRISEKRQLDELKACELVMAMDKKRKAWIERIAGKNSEKSIYDITFNKSSFDEDYIVEAIYEAMISKGMIKNRMVADVL